jgi:hypothetical protein
MNGFTDLDNRLPEEMVGDKPVCHDHKFICVNKQAVIDLDCETHPSRCYAMKIALRYYHPEYTTQDETRDYGISRTDVLTINVEGTEKKVEGVKNNLKRLCENCKNRLTK